MVAETACPTVDTLTEHARNGLAPQETVRVDAHLAQCRSCLDRFVELGRRSLAPEIPHCHVVKEIGRGRFGVVYKAWWLKDKPRLVALKVLSCSGEMEKSRFEREIAVLKKIDSPWIVKCLDSGETNEAAYYVMECVEGVHVDEYLAESAPDLDAKLAVFERVCRAVAEAHDNGVVHRDLKPRNILIDSDGQPHILDFGICSLEAPDWSSWERVTITHPGDVIGTLKYMSPEQAWGGAAGSIDERSDLWALGVMLHEIVTGGKYPYPLKATPDKPAHEALLERIRKQLPRIPKLDHLPRGRDLEVLLERCLVWERDHRIDSARQLADDVGRYRKGQRIRTRPLWIPYRLRRLAVGVAVRSRWVCLLALVALVTTAFAFAGTPLRLGWHVKGHQYHGQDDPSAALIGPGAARDGILMVGVFDETVDAVVDFASTHAIDNVSKDLRTWRAVHGHLMERLSTAGPKAVVWDYYFQTARAGDADLVSGILALEQAKIPVMLAANAYDEQGRPFLSPGIVEPLGWHLRHGAILASDQTESPGQFVMAVKHGRQATVPTLPLTTLAALLHPETRLDLGWPKEAGFFNWHSNRVDLLYQVQSGGYLREQDRFQLTVMFMTGRDQAWTRKGDQFACNRFRLETPDNWERRTVPYHTLLSHSDEELRARVANKLLIIGDLRRARFGFVPDRYAVRYGVSTIDDVPGCYLMADAVAGLLDKRYLKAAVPLPQSTFLLILAAAITGSLVPIKLAKRKSFEKPTRRRLLWGALAGLSAVSFFVMVVTKNYATVHAGMMGLSLLMLMYGSFWVEFARNRHRVVDRGRDALDDLGLQTVDPIAVSAEQATGQGGHVDGSGETPTITSPLR